jgi:glycosyltransferase involved in cell wall biosynthesis
MKEKINVLVIPSDTSGCGKYRSIDPHTMLQSLYNDEFHVDIDYNPDIDNLNFWKKYQIVHFHRNIGNNYNATPQLIKTLRELGVITIMDIDDYWNPGKEHPIYNLIVQHQINKKIVANMKEVDYVTTTTSLFADEIKKINKNVFVFPNAVNPEEPQFKAVTPPSDKIRIGWLGGSSHLHDLKLLDGMVSKLDKPILERTQFVICGFDTRGTVTQINPQTGEEKKRDILPHETVWARYEEIFTNNYKIINDDYKKFLMEFKEEEFKSEKELPYVRVWTKPVTSYASNYSKFDISLAPIKNHMFNRMKSQLKVIEAGFYKKALIASDVGPYTLDLKHCLENGNFVDGNAILISERRNHSDWGKAIKKLVSNPNMIEDLGERLYETVKDTYDLRNVSRDRAEWYKSLIK